MKLQIAIVANTESKITLALGGRLDSHTSPELERAFQEINSARPQQMVLDLCELGYISSAGLRAILKQRNTLSAQGGGILLVNLQPQVRRVFDIIKALPAQIFFSSFQELDEYLAAL